uniref:Uncharacterized protein n=1 Tax=Cacopsylla melanoneura TaxID=428564 RepID=A0A8D8R9F0_9HEMI
MFNSFLFSINIIIVFTSVRFGFKLNHFFSFVIVFESLSFSLTFSSVYVWFCTTFIIFWTQSVVIFHVFAVFITFSSSQIFFFIRSFERTKCSLFQHHINLFISSFLYFCLEIRWFTWF